MSALILGAIALYALTRPRLSLSRASLGEGYMNTHNITINLSALPDISTEIDLAFLTYPSNLDPGGIPIIQVRVKFYNTMGGTWVFCRIRDTDTGDLVTRYRSVLIPIGGDDAQIFTFSGTAPLGDWLVTMPNVPWNLTIECGIAWLS